MAENEETADFKFSVRLNWETEKDDRDPFALIYGEEAKKNEKVVTKYEFEGKSVLLSVFNKEKEERFKTQNTGQYRGFNGFVTVVFPDERNSIDQASYQNTEIVRYTHDQIFIITVVFKSKDITSIMTEQDKTNFENPVCDNYHFAEVEVDDSEKLKEMVKGIAQALMALSLQEKEEEEKKKEEEEEKKKGKKGKKDKKKDKKSKKGDKEKCCIV
ncbi:hypothetical protein EIN_283800 [Entamoeba invadens IP1]|uniref:Uncharacterized protein n=1 Tax=Entamoeba invadens IP1 TaxID=370355 RepID=L7FKL7_ENTIV|nr:hypothetical protein EIN_283800 [Entamoeba invadens IP1]ELP84834.1 hypothetical protein EIN_283800 [Entamoeba invadens IP1]|eukprot:XP_004184180.1 hypothetical protein EIN_283800 [Entamoeba invadens IP1]